MKHPVVWVVKEQMARGEIGSAPMDYSPALQYGDLEFITFHDMPMYGRSSVQAQWNRDVGKFILEYDPVRDYIVTTGQPIAILAIGFALGQAGKCPRFLVWRREENRYRVVNFDPTFDTSLVA